MCAISVMILPLLIAVALFMVIATGRYISRRKTSNYTHFPPGPPADPIIGHARIMPHSNNFPWKTFAEWGKQWGGLLYLHVLGEPMIIINDLRIARKLMEKRGAIYSDRPPLLMISEMMGWNKVVAFKRYNDKNFRVQRKMMQQHLSAHAVLGYREMQRKELYIFLENLLKSPEIFVRHLHRFTTATIMMTTYGYTIKSDDDEYTALIEKAIAMTVEPGPAGGTLVDLFPFVRFMPTWLPGAGFKRHALKTRELVDKSLTKPFDLVQRNRALGIALPSVISSLIDEYEVHGVVNLDYEKNIMGVGGNMYAAGFETTSSSLLTFILAMIHCPEVVQRAQTEIDRVTGKERMPTLEDKDQLPFIDCILKETFRWNPPLPLGLPHRLMERDILDGMHIPEGSTIIPNIWQFMWDDRVFPEPDRFNPERFLEEPPAGVSEEDFNPLNIVFGFGRRICPGQFMAETVMWMTIASVLAAFDIKAPLDDKGREYIPEAKFTSGTTSQPEYFRCRIVPRNEKLLQLIRQEIFE